MDKKRDILFPIGFNSLPMAAIAYNMRLKTEVNEEVDKKLAEMRLQLESDFNIKLEKMRKDLQSELRKEILEEIRRHDSGWEKVDHVEESEK